MAPSIRFNSLLGTTNSSSKNNSTPNPSQSGQAPYGALNEKSLGSISGIEKPETGQEKFSEKTIFSFSTLSFMTSATAIPPASSNAVLRLSAIL